MIVWSYCAVLCIFFWGGRCGLRYFCTAQMFLLLQGPLYYSISAQFQNQLIRCNHFSLNLGGLFGFSLSFGCSCSGEDQFSDQIYPVALQRVELGSLTGNGRAAMSRWDWSQELLLLTHSTERHLQSLIQSYKNK